MKWVVPMYESERGWGAKVDGYSGPFETLEEAKTFVKNYNEEYNSEPVVPDWYIKALEPVEYTGQTCIYKNTV